MCNTCSKIFCKDRNKKEECTEKITYVQTNMLEQPKKEGDCNKI